MLNGLDAVFTPHRVALVGASERPGSVGRLVWENLSTFPGEVVPVSTHATVLGRRAYPTLADVPGEIDLAVVAVPASRVLQVIRAAAVTRVRAAVILSAGFAETGSRGAVLQQEVLAVARSAGLRLIGPNSFGVQNADLPLNASIAAGLHGAARPGRSGLSLVTQSGAYGMAVHALARDARVPIAKVLAVGNKCDVADHEVLEYLADDPATDVICLMLESISQPREFFDQARRVTRGKPVLATVTGRSVAGRRAALSHTASLATDDALRDAMLRQAGVTRIRTGLQLLDAARTVIGQPLPAGGRVGIITNSGGTGVELADLLSDEGLSVPELSVTLQAELATVLPAFAGTRNPVDMTPVWSSFPSLYAELVDLLARSGEIDVVVPILLQRAASEPVAIAVRDAVEALRRSGSDVPVYVCWVAPDDAKSGADLLQEAGVPCLDWPERTAQAVGVAVRCGATIASSMAAWSTSGSAASVTVPATRPEPTSRETRETSRAAAEPTVSGRPAGTVLAQRDLLIGAGVRIAATESCASPDEAVAAAHRIGYPVTLKVDHPSLPHKSDVGGVRPALSDPHLVRAAAIELVELAHGARVLVQQQHQGLQLAVGALRDPGLGPVVMVGFGGIHIEVMADRQFALAPISVPEARRMWLMLRAAPLLEGHRGSAAVDLAALSALTVAIGDLMVSNPDLGEIDLNPVLAGPDGYVAVDWRVVTENLPSHGESR